MGMLYLMAMFYFGPILVALSAAALMLPRSWLGWYAALAIATIIIFSDYSGGREDSPFAGLGAFVFSTMATCAVIVGLIARWLMGEVRPTESRSRRPD
jgi:hypothetical protein